MWCIRCRIQQRQVGELGLGELELGLRIRLQGSEGGVAKRVMAEALTVFKVEGRSLEGARSSRAWAVEEVEAGEEGEGPGYPDAKASILELVQYM